MQAVRARTDRIPQHAVPFSLAARRARIDAARTQDELLEVLARYCETLSPSVHPHLPPGHAENPPRSLEEIGRRAFELSRCDRGGRIDLDMRESILEIARTFAHAAEHGERLRG